MLRLKDVRAKYPEVFQDIEDMELYTARQELEYLLGVLIRCEKDEQDAINMALAAGSKDPDEDLPW